jgi:hypothetical protein
MFSIHETYKKMGNGRKALKLPGSVVLKHIPELPPIAMAVYLNVTAYEWFKGVYPIPRRAKKRISHGILSCALFFMTTTTMP